MAKQPKYQFGEQGYYISFDPLRDGNYQFSSICRILRELSFQRSPQALRAEIVSYMEGNPNNPNGTPLNFYMDDPFNKYLNRMSIDGTLGDEVIFTAAAELFNIEFVVTSTLSRAAEATITPQNFALQGRVYLVHFVENHGKHYVALNPVEDPDKSILNPVENFDKPNESLHFDKSFSNLPPELV